LAGDRPVTGLILSDVIGDDLRAIASGPTVAPIGDRVAALKTCNELEIFDKLPKSIRDHLSSSAYETIPKQATNILVGSNQISLQAMRLPSGKGNVVPTPICGDVKDAAKKIAELGRGIHFLGGETTVVLTGTGKGGRNQDLALRVALIAEDEGWDDPWFYLQAGTDGRDGPTDAAGGIVDNTTLAKIRASGIDPRAALQNNDAYTALKAGQGLLITGGTATNVADLGVLIRR
jgi:hydroxypyruvate reductase